MPTAACVLISTGMQTGSDDIDDITEEWIILPLQRPLPAVTEKRANLVGLILESRAIPWRAERSGIGWQLLVPESQLSRALDEIASYNELNRNWPPLLPPPPTRAENTLATLSVLILLATFHNVTRMNILPFAHTAPDWVTLGNAQAARILDGEWWRLVTSLTLHANVSHLLGNLTIGGLFIILLCREIGSGLSWFLLLASGALGNLANAHFNLPTHSSVGASTLVFGGVGILAAISMLRHRNYLNRRWPMPIAAALSLLAILGTEGENTDLGAHFFGFLFGILLGLSTGYLLERYGRPATTTNRLLSLLSAATLAAAWYTALHSR